MRMTSPTIQLTGKAMPSFSRTRYSLSSAVAIVAAAALLPGLPATAQTCESPIVLQNGMNHADTCQASNSLPALGGGLPSPHRDVVFSFQVPSSPANGIISVSADFPAAFVLIPAPCGMITVPIAAAWPGELIVVDASVPPGQYFVVATGDPILTGDICGNVWLTAEFPGGWDDVIFADGFES